MVTNKTEIAVKFSEVDSLRIVWHGNYVRYFEDGREAFGRQYGLGYLDVHAQGFALPIVDLQVNFKRMLEYGDNAIIETTLIDRPAAKLVFEYTITSVKHGYVVCTGKSTQVFINPVTKELMITMPTFMLEWKKKWIH